MKNLILTVFIAVLFCSCGTTKKVTKEKEFIYITDTTEVEKEVIKIVTVTEKVTDTLEVKLPCDETGKLKDFSRKIKTASGTVKVWSKNGSIFAELILEETKNSTETDKQKILKSKGYVYTKTITKYQTKTIYKERWWLWLWFGGSILYIAYKIYRFFTLRK